MRWQLRDTLPVVELPDVQQHSWLPLRDLFGADRFTRGFVTEIDERARTQLRFGDDILGLRPTPTEIFKAIYRIGNGRSGNVGAGAINAIDSSIKDVKGVRNPLPAEGGVDPESLEAVRQFAPEAFRVQERAVTEADWAEVAERHPEVQQAAARFRWTGSWFTVFVTIDRRRGAPMDAEFVLRMRAHLERYRIAGYDLEVKAPRFVPLDLLVHVCVKPGYRRSDVKQQLLAVFSNRVLDDGALGFFHPDNFTFGQPVYLSRIYQAAMGVAGVASAEVQRFQRWGEAANDELDKGLLAPAALEIIRLDNDSNFQENGRIEFELGGGL
jgi:predicted phage baseplate assembly protein